MPWETRHGRGHYYTRSYRDNGKIVRDYVGCDDHAQAIAALDTQRRAARHAQRQADAAERAELDALDAQLEDFYQQVDALVRATLIAAGYHQPNRGPWRRRRTPVPSPMTEDVSPINAPRLPSEDANASRITADAACPAAPPSPRLIPSPSGLRPPSPAASAQGDYCATPPSLHHFFSLPLKEG